MRRRCGRLGNGSLAAALVVAVLATVSTPAASTSGFGDVDANAFYTDAVQWMVDNAITTGVSATCFAPDEPVTRGEAAAFLWRMEGAAAPVTTHPFADVMTSWQHDPVSWLFENEITTGTSLTTYTPDGVLTRGQMAVLLHRLAGSPVPTASPTFGDVTAEWQITPVAWLAATGITTGTSPSTFSPDDAVTRGQVATLLYRYRGSPPIVVDPDSRGCETFNSLAGINTIDEFSGFTSSGLAQWSSSVPGIQDIQIPSTADDTQQSMLWLPPVGDADQPIMVILHSWNADYRQHAGIPHAMWAQENGWAVIAPDFRGPNDDPSAGGSDLAVQDVVDAIDFAVTQGGVDADAVYAVGYSGGGMMALLLAGRHPDKVTAVASWGPPHDLAEFYAHSQALARPYTNEIAAVCGGNPTVSDLARDECLRRSPLTYLPSIAENEIPVLIAQGIRDPIVQTSAAAEIFNPLAAPSDRLSGDQIQRLGAGIVDVGLPPWAGTHTFFGPGDPAPVFARRSGPVLLVYFDATHDMVYGATARWFASDPG